MQRNSLIVIFSVILTGLAGSLRGGDYSLAVDGVSRISVIAPGKYSSVELNSAEEFRNCFEAVTGTLPRLVRTAEKGLYPVWIGTLDNPAMPLPAKLKKAAAKIQEDGFLLSAGKEGIFIVGRIPRGTLYGVYDFFQRFAGVRWIFPGKDGEFIPRKKTWAVPDFEIVSNPGFKYREFGLVSSYSSHETMRWMLHNKMHVSVAKMQQQNSYDWKQWGQPLIIGGHIFSSLLDDKLFTAHPEYFAQIKGKRIPQKNARKRWQAQTCSSNPEGLKIMCDSLEKMLLAHPGVERLLILNNDIGGWCECSECARLGDKNNDVANRFWNIANALAGRARRVVPGILVDVHGYQSFQAPPDKVEPLAHVGVNVCVHHRCYVHSIDDPQCEYNNRYRDIYQAWKQKKVSSIGTYEYTNCLPGWGYLPLEHILARDIAYYHKLGFSKYTDEVLPMDGYSQGRPMPVTPYRGSMLSHYIQAVFLWNPDADFNTVYNDAGSHLYGKAWPAMKKYRDLLRRCYEQSNLYLCYGSGGSLLRQVLEQPQAEKRLTAYLEEAGQQAKGNRVAEEQISFEKKRFQEVFLNSPALPKGTATVFSGSATGKIDLDGKDGESDWGYSRWASHFRKADGTPSRNETWIKFLFDDKNLYFYFEAQGPAAAASDFLKIKVAGKVLQLSSAGIVSGGEGWKGKVLRTGLGWQGEYMLALSRPVSISSGLAVGVSRHLPEETSSWQAAGDETLPANSRRVFRGMWEWLANGDFESVAEAGENRQWSTQTAGPKMWMQAGGNAELIKGDASSGSYFLRATQGTGVIYQEIAAVNRQTYRERRIFPRYRVRLDVKGQGKVQASVRLSDRNTNVQSAAVSVNAPEWQALTLDIDSSSYQLSALYFFLTIGRGVSVDNISLESLNQ